MPSKAPGRCTQCPVLATTKGRCDEHQRKAWENPSANTRALTGGQRARFRAEVMQASDGKCAWCGQPATEADHIRAIGLGGSPTDSTHNGMGLCSECHVLKTESDNNEMRHRLHLY